MTLTTTDILVALVLFSCVPLQYFIVQNWGNSESSRSYAIKRFVTYMTRVYDEIRNFKFWLFQQLEKYAIRSYDDVHESPAVEVIKFKHDEAMKIKQDNVYFGLSPEPRIHRPPNVEFRVGQVVVHKTLNYRGVIVGWDEKAKAPPYWIEKIDKEDELLKDSPNYAVLIDTRDKLIPQLFYAPQVRLEVITNTKIFHPLIDHYFENYDGAQYIPRPWLQTLYPQD